MIDIQVYRDEGAGAATTFLNVYGATTGNITLSGNQVFDGITGLTGRRILVKHQTDPSQNGIYDANTSGAWTLASDNPTTDDVVIKSLVGYVGTGAYWKKSGTSFPRTIAPLRGTPIEVVNFNMKDTATYLTAYFPTNEEASAPLVRPLDAGAQTLSYKVFTFFKLSGSYSWIKNLRFRVTMETSPEANDAQLFFKNTNVYETPNNAFDGRMILLADKNGVVYSDPIYPMISTVGPHLATTRQVAYNNQPLYTNYFVTQIRVNKGSTVGNTAEMKLKFEAYEYYEI